MRENHNLRRFHVQLKASIAAGRDQAAFADKQAVFNDGVIDELITEKRAGAKHRIERVLSGASRVPDNLQTLRSKAHKHVRARVAPDTHFEAPDLRLYDL
jgi:hypothetical protein